MSEFRLVRCPKCDKVLPEPQVFTVYQCGGCGAMLKAKKKSPGSEKSGESDSVLDKGVEREAGDIIQEGGFGMDNRSPARSTFGDNDGNKSTFEESDFGEFYGGLPKSPMRDRFLNDLGSTPMLSRNVSPSPIRSRNVSPSPIRSRNVSPSPIRGTNSGDPNSEGFGMSPARSRSRNVSKSPIRDRGSKSPMSVRTRNVSKSPVRGRDGNISNSLDGTFVKERDDFDGEEGVRSDKMTPKTSFNFWIPDDTRDREPKYNDQGRRRRTWRDSGGNEIDKIDEGMESVYVDERGMTSDGSINDHVHKSGFSKGEIDRNPRFRGDYVGGNERPTVIADQWHRGNYGDGVIPRKSRVVESGRNSASSNSIGGTLSYYMDSIHGYGRTRQGFGTQRGLANIHYSEVDESYLEEEHIRYGGGPMHGFPPDNIPRRSYFNHGLGFAEREDMYDHSSLYDDPFSGPMKRDYHPEIPYPHRSRMGYVPRKSLEFDQDSLSSYHDGTHIDHPSCSCSLCVVSYRKPPNRGSYPTTSHSMNLQRRTRTYDPRMAHTNPRERPSHLTPHNARRVMIATQNKRICLPLAGGSPFVLCHECFELLKIPGKFMNKHKKEYQLQCGACSCIMSFDLQNNFTSVISTPKKPDQVYNNTTSGLDSSNEPGLRHNRFNSYGAISTNLGSYDFDAIGSSFQSMDSPSNETSRKQRFSSNFDEKIRASSPSSRSSKDSASVKSTPRNSSELQKLRPPPGSPLRDHIDYSNQFLKIGEKSGEIYTEKRKEVLEKDTYQESSMVNTGFPSENEVYSHELPSSSSGSVDIPRENKDGNKDKPSSWKGFAPKSPKSGQGTSEVYVNGQNVPLHVVKKAEKLAGPIEPGNYWYDPKAGFWGVMGKHCYGIIPPSIQEFSFPMPEDCCQGDTSIYVNGRELQKRDLDLLTKRGLPTMKGKRYIIDMSGKVLEEQSKDFIVNLGKLAPTVERNKCGFGMRVPEQFKV